LAYAAIASDRDETKTVHGTFHGPAGSGNMQLDLPTGRTIKGDPDVARFVALLWTLALPAGLAYFLFLLTRTGATGLALLTGIAVVVAVVYATMKMHDADDGAWAWLRRRWWRIVQAVAVVMICTWGYVGLDALHAAS
jgi:hypothetical protein